MNYRVNTKLKTLKTLQYKLKTLAFSWKSVTDLLITSTAAVEPWHFKVEVAD